MKMNEKHFVPNKNSCGDGTPACNCFGDNLYAFPIFKEVAKTRVGVTCKNCQRTRVFKKLK